MKRLSLLSLLVLFICGTSFAQSVEDLKAKKAELSGIIGAEQAAVDAKKAELAAINKQLTVLSGWNTGLTGLIGLDFGGANSWIANPNPTSTTVGLALGATAYANREHDKYFWNNKLIVNKAWRDIDISKEDNDKLFDNGTVDLLNLSSLAGYKLTPKLALSAEAALNSSIQNFLNPGTLDFGVGITWKPITNLVVVVHPLNYHIAWAAGESTSAGSLGARLKADYQNNFMLLGRKIAWSSTLAGFIPYSNKKTAVANLDKYGNSILDSAGATTTRDAGLGEWTWLNGFSFQVWDGIGVGVNLGLRNADFEINKLQTFYTVGATYTL